MLLSFTTTLYIFVFWVICISILCIYSTRNFGYWKKRNVSGPRPLPIIGNILEIIRLQNSLGDYFKNLYDRNDKPYVGFFIFDNPCLLIKSPDLIKGITIRDFGHFIDRTVASPKHDVFANLLFAQKGDLWKSTRQKLSPVFSTAKLRSMFDMLKDIGTSFTAFLKNNPGVHDARDLSVSYSIDVITKCFFGIHAYSFEDKNAYFKKIGQAMFGPSLRNGFSQGMYFFKTGLVSLLRLRFFEENAQHFFINAFLKTVETRQETNDKVNDFIATLIAINKEDPTFDYSKIAAQGVQFFAAGFETTASTISFTLYEMAMAPEIQDKARAEIMSTLKKSTTVTYDSLKEMKYLNRCISETLRKYPPLPFLDRRCIADYQVPGSDLVIEKGMALYISVIGVHNDVRYFPEPQKYNPDRFVENPNSEKLIYFPFGEGPRICIGKKFALITVRLALAHVLSNFVVEKTADTPKTIEFHPRNFTIQPKFPLLLKFKEISR